MRLVGDRLVARLRPGDDFHQQAAHAQPGDGFARHFKSGQQAHEHPVETILLGRARAARRAEHGPAAGIRQEQQVAGIDRHAEMLDAPADRLNRGRDHVATVGDRGRAEHDHEFGALAQHLFDRLRQRGLLMRHAALGDDGGAGRREALLGDLEGLFDDLAGEPGKERRDHADLADAVGRDGHQRPSRAGDRERRIAHPAGDRERNDLHGRDHLARTTGL